MRPRKIVTLASVVCSALVGCGGDAAGPNPEQSSGPHMYVFSGLTSSAISGGRADPAPRARVIDAQGRPLAFHPIRFAITGGTGSLVRADTLTDANGEARAEWVLTNSYNELSVSLPSGLSLRITGLVASRLIPLTNQSRTGFPGDEVTPPSVVVVDTFGRPVPNIPVTFTVTSGNGQLDRDEVRSGPTGYAQLWAWTLGTPGLQTVTASVGGTGSVEFTAVALDSAAATWYATDVFQDTNGPIQYRLAIQNNYFVQELYRGAQLHRVGRWSGEVVTDSKNVTLLGCEWWAGDNYTFCNAKTGYFEGDALFIGSLRYSRLKTAASATR